MQLPIEVIPGSRPPRFRWRYVADTPNGKQTVEQEGSLPPSIEVAVERLIVLARQLQAENAGLRDQLNGLTRPAEERADVKQSAATGGKRGGR